MQTTRRKLQNNLDVYVVVQFYFLLFLGMVMSDNEFKTKEKKN